VRAHSNPKGWWLWLGRDRLFVLVPSGSSSTHGYLSTSRRVCRVGLANSTHWLLTFHRLCKPSKRRFTVNPPSRDLMSWIANGSVERAIIRSEAHFSAAQGSGIDIAPQPDRSSLSDQAQECASCSCASNSRRNLCPASTRTPIATAFPYTSL
jgi:hypothetical protein